MAKKNVQNTNQPASKKWVASDDVMTTVRDLIANYHPDLALCDDEIAVLFKEKASSVGEALVAGKTTKASDLIGLLGEVEYKFIITLGADVWEGMTDSQRIALLDHHLCACGVEENPQTGNIRFFVRIPDVAFYKDEVERHGWWRTSGSMPQQDLIDELFG